MSHVLHHFRPPGDWRILACWRYDNGYWSEDDGEPDLAFVCKAVPSGSRSGNWFPFALGYRLRHGTYEAPFWITKKDRFWPAHPNSIAMNSAMDFCCKTFGAANGVRLGASELRLHAPDLRKKKDARLRRRLDNSLQRAS